MHEQGGDSRVVIGRFLNTKRSIILRNMYYYAMSVNRNFRRFLLPSKTLEKCLGKLRIRILVFVIHLCVDIHIIYVHELEN